MGLGVDILLELEWNAHLNAEQWGPESFLDGNLGSRVDDRIGLEISATDPIAENKSWVSRVLLWVLEFFFVNISLNIFEKWPIYPHSEHLYLELSVSMRRFS